MWKHILKAGFHWWQSWSRNSLRTGSLFSKRKKTRGEGRFPAQTKGLFTGWSHESVHDLVKIKNRVASGVISAMESESEDQNISISFNSAYTPSLTFRLWTSENQIVVVGGRSGRINQSQCTFVIGLVVPLLFLTPAIWFLLDHTWNLSDGVVGGNHNAVFTRS